MLRDEVQRTLTELENDGLMGDVSTEGLKRLIRALERAFHTACSYDSAKITEIEKLVFKEAYKQGDEFKDE